jgi:hypothetical protein
MFRGSSDKLIAYQPNNPGPGNGSGAIPGAVDPNQKLGPSGFGPAGYISPSITLPYRIDFENDATATAPAQIVTITDQLDPDLDWSTFALTEIGFGDHLIAVPANAQHFETTVPMHYNGQDFEVQIEAGINLATGQVFAHFYSIDPDTSLPPDVLTGFLPPEDGTGRGMGTCLLPHRPETRPRHRHRDPEHRPDLLRRPAVDRHQPDRPARPGCGHRPRQGSPQHHRRRRPDQRRASRCRRRARAPTSSSSGPAPTTPAAPASPATTSTSPPTAAAMSSGRTTSPPPPPPSPVRPATATPSTASPRTTSAIPKPRRRPPTPPPRSSTASPSPPLPPMPAAPPSASTARSTPPPSTSTPPRPAARARPTLRSSAPRPAPSPARSSSTTTSRASASSRPAVHWRPIPTP